MLGNALVSLVFADAARRNRCLAREPEFAVVGADHVLPLV